MAIAQVSGEDLWDVGEVRTLGVRVMVGPDEWYCVCCQAVRCLSLAWRRR